MTNNTNTTNDLKCLDKIHLKYGLLSTKFFFVTLIRLQADVEDDLNLHSAYMSFSLMGYVGSFIMTNKEILVLIDTYLF